MVYAATDWRELLSWLNILSKYWKQGPQTRKWKNMKNKIKKLGKVLSDVMSRQYKKYK